MPNRKSLYRAMEILPLLLVVVLVFSAICLANSKEIVLRYDGQEKVVTTILEDPRSILEESGVKVGKEDRIMISPANAEKKTREVIELKRALPVTIEKYGVSKKFYTGKATVGEALDALAINYEGKTVKFKARVMKPRGMGSKFFVPGRTAMTCCADDTTFLGYVCKSAYAPKLTPGEWVEVTAKVGIEKRNEYQGEEGIVLAAEHVEQCDPLEDEMVYFN